MSARPQKGNCQRQQAALGRRQDATATAVHPVRLGLPADRAPGLNPPQSPVQSVSVGAPHKLEAFDAPSLHEVQDEAALLLGTLRSTTAAICQTLYMLGADSKI